MKIICLLTRPKSYVISDRMSVSFDVEINSVLRRVIFLWHQKSKILDFSVILV